MESEPGKGDYYKCIKTSLKSIAKNDIVIDKLIQTSNMTNKIVIHTLQFIKLYFIHLYDTNQNLPKIDKQIITSVMKIVCNPPVGGDPSESTRILKDRLKIFYDTHIDIIKFFKTKNLIISI